MIRGPIARRHYPAVLLALLCSLFDGTPARAGIGGSLSIETLGFLKNAADRAESITSIALSPYVTYENSKISTRVETLALTYITNTASFSPEVIEGYIATSKKWTGDKHQISLGRRLYEWSRFEKGTQFLIPSWSPRFGWQPFDQKQIGWTGLFYTYEHPKVRVTMFATPVGIPERGLPQIFENGKVIYPTPWGEQMPASLPVLGQNISLNYAMGDINYAKLLLRPGFAASVRYGDLVGPWTRAGYGILPASVLNIGMKAQVDPNEKALMAEVAPRGLHDERVTFEGGYEGSFWSVWTSVNHVRPMFIPENNEGYIFSPVGTGLLFGLGGDVRISNGVSIDGAFASTWEGRPKPEGDIPFDMGPRYGYGNMFRLGAKYAGPSRLTYAGGWIFDIDRLAQLFSLDLAIHLGKRRLDRAGPWYIGVGADFFVSQGSQGPVGKYVGNDLLRAKVAYYF